VTSSTFYSVIGQKSCHNHILKRYIYTVNPVLYISYAVYISILRKIDDRTKLTWVLKFMRWRKTQNALWSIDHSWTAVRPFLFVFICSYNLAISGLEGSSVTVEGSALHGCGEMFPIRVSNRSYRWLCNMMAKLLWEQFCCSHKTVFFG
jgi:hypothetical protein